MINQQNKKSTNRLFLIRHAQSQYNAAIKKLHDTPGISHSKFLRLKKQAKFSEEFLDCPITSQGLEEISRISEFLQDIDIEIIYTSPLLRCLQTTKEILKNCTNKPEVYVVPELKDITSSSCDIGRNLEKIKMDFPDYNYVFFNKLKDPFFWYIEILEDFSENILKFDQKDILAKMIECGPESVETRKSFEIRIDKIINIIKNHARNLTIQNFVIVGHSKILSYVNKDDYKKKFNNCGIVEQTF